MCSSLPNKLSKKKSKKQKQKKETQKTQKRKYANGLPQFLWAINMSLYLRLHCVDRSAMG